MRSGNPSLTKDTFTRERGHIKGERMTLQGAVNKSFIMVLLVILSAAFTCKMYFDGANITGFMIGGAIGGFIIALITIFVPKVSPYTAPIYAILEGLFIGGISAFYETQFQGITIQAILITFGIFLALLFIYKSGIIKVTENFKLGVAAATFGIFIVYLISFILSLFGVNVPFLHDANLIGIGISLFIIVIASLNLVLDFDFIEEGAASGSPKYMEWYSAFGLLVTLIWLYIEILRLLWMLYSYFRD